MSAERIKQRLEECRERRFLPHGFLLEILDHGTLLLATTIQLDRDV